MDNRFFIWAAVGLLWLLVYQTWQMENAPQSLPEMSLEEGLAPSDEAAIPPPPDANLPSLPNAIATAVEAAPTVSGESRTIRVTTDVFDMLIDTKGAVLQDVQLLGYPKRKDQPDDLVVLLDPNPATLILIQSGMLSREGPAPNHEAVFEALLSSYELQDGADELVVPLTWRNADGVSATKTFRFYRSRYNIDVDMVVSNAGAQAWAGAPYQQIQRKEIELKRSFVDVDSYSFTGPVFFDGSAADKYKPKKLRKEPIDANLQGGWIASIQHHFLSAAVPDSQTPMQYSSRVTETGVELISAVGPLSSVNAGATQTFSHTLFLGPKNQKQLKDTAPGLVRTVDYGVLSILSQPLFWLLQKIHDLVQNWGLAIILMTVFIKILFYPLAEKSGRSMAKMRNLAPRMKTLQDRYKDDRQALSKAMMELYKREQVNPMSSCLPLLLQMPVFLALYWVLLESVELRQAPFALWITDLSSRDPFFVLPLIMAVAMFVQTKLNPPPADPTTAKVMMLMPLMMSVFFAFFPAGLVLYWVVNTILSVLQQWRINRVVEAGAA